MITSQLRIQLNLYSHREQDNAIIKGLRLDTSLNPNNDIRELLYNISKGIEVSTIPLDNTNVEELNKLKTENEILRVENEKLKMENLILKQLSLKSSNAPIEKEVADSKQEAKELKLNNKLLNSIKQMDI